MMKKIIGTEGCPEVTSQEIVCGTFEDQGKVKLANGVWLDDMGDGRFYESDNELREWADVSEYDDTFDQEDPSAYEGESKFIGFVEL